MKVAKKFWSSVEDQLIRDIYPDVPTSDIAALLDRGESSVYQHAAALGLRKSEAFYSSDVSTRIQRGKQHPAMIASRIKPGTPAWNKGLKGVNGISSTRFRPGSLSGAAKQKLRAIGETRVSKDGCLEQKVSASAWMPVHRIVWESVHGSVPTGHIVRFIPGKKTAKADQITIERLECISRAENALRNTEPDPEIKRLHQLRGAITRQVNRIAREAESPSA